MDALCNATIHTGDAVHTGLAVLVDAGRIVGLIPNAAVPAGVLRLDLGGGVLAPGFIDLQVNGGGGVLFNDSPDVPTIRRIGAAHRRFGTTGFLPTLITDSRDKRQAAMTAVRTALADGVPGVLGIHLEGPHINPARRGVHESRWIGPPDAADLALMTSLGTGRTLVTLAPETVAPAVIRTLVSHGVRVAAGHSAASYAETGAALAEGITGFTHLFNAMPPLAGREPGIVGAALDDAASWCGVIADGHHVRDAMLRLAWRAKAPRRLFLVTDAMSVVGAENGDGNGNGNGFMLLGESITVAEGRCLTADGRLAGSALDMAAAVRHCVRRLGIPLAEALRMASTYPAEFLGVADRHGRIAPGYAADLVHLDDDLRVRATWIGGEAA